MEIQDLQLSNPEADLAIVDRMIELRLQLAAIEQEIDTLQPAFYAACAALSEDRIDTPRAIITRRRTPGRWLYPLSVTTVEETLNQQKLRFQKENEPVSGRELIWAIRLVGSDPADP